MTPKPLGSWWTRRLPSAPEEVVEERWLGNHKQGHTARGGLVVLTNHRLVFLPHRLDALLGARRWSAPLEHIDSVAVRDRGRDVYGGGVRRRLEVGLGDGTEELFVVNGVDAVVARIRAATAASAGG